MKQKLVYFLLFALMLVPAYAVQAQEATPPPLTPPTHAEVIERVNTLRLMNGLPALAVHPVLMQIGQEQADGIASGLGGHWRPNGLTLGQWMISLGYPLSGDLSQDGYRSENWVTAETAETAILSWLGDDPHTNTMLSPNRSDLGVGITPYDGTYIIVLETALQTTNGQMQSSASSFLTGVPLTQQAFFVAETLAAENGTLPQHQLPVVINTANSAGDVFHEVQYGETLWSLAITYNTTIKDIQLLNNWHTTDVYVGQLLLVKKGATPPAQPMPVSATQTFISPQATSAPYHTPTASSTPQTELITTRTPQELTLSLIGVALAAVVLGGVFAFSRKSAK